MDASNDDSESVDQFLARIASLSNRKDGEEAERARKMEEDMMQARKERQARRAERARSISPVKTGPASSTIQHPRVGNSPRERSIEPPVALTPRSQTQTPSRTGPGSPEAVSARLASSPLVDGGRPLPPPPSNDQPPSPSYPANNTTSLSRSGTLSWQQRPLSRGFGSVRSRPLSGSRSPVRNPPEPSKPAVVEPDQPTPSRQEIAASLSSHDPSWFRQTQDRGIGSAAYRKSTSQELEADRSLQTPVRLPGMAPGLADSSLTTSRTAHSRMPQLDESTKPVSLIGGTVPTTVSQSSRLKDSPLPVPSSTTDTFAPSSDSVPSKLASTSEDDIAFSRSASTLRPGRSPSPTKGLGGFVESAMMRRSDSVSKRWSVQANAGLKRGDSIASNRPVFNPPTTTTPLGHARTISREPRNFRDGTSSPLGSSRPSSSHDASHDVGLHKSSPSVDQPGGPSTTTQRADVRESSPKHDVERPSTPPMTEPSLNRSPSKTLDPRRWSPTKASWLESALSKPESPKPGPARPETPAWKLDMQKSKSQKDLQESPKRQNALFDPVSTGGLLRSPPPGTATKVMPLSGEAPLKHGRREELSLQAIPKPEADQVSVGLQSGNKPREEVSGKDLPRSGPWRVPDEAVATTKLAESRAASKETEAAEKTSPEATTDFRSSPSKQTPVLKPKPQTPPKTDLRSALKTRSAEDASSGGNEPEFRAVFGKLKRTQTQNYVAPDVLKDNITRGKAGLSITGGPQPRKRVDEFKESILQKKEAMKQSGSTNKKPDAEKPPPDVPEALARRQMLHKSKLSSDMPSEKFSSSKPPPLDEKSAREASKTSSWSRNIEAKPQPSPKSESVKNQPKPVIKEVSEPQPKVVSTQDFGAPLSQSSSKSEPTVKNVERTSSPRNDTAGMIGGKLAARLNPALASLIARGNSPRPASDSVPAVVERNAAATAEGFSSKATPAGALEHVTKGRARGPKRRAPKAETKTDAVVSKPALSSSIATSQSTIDESLPEPVKTPSWKKALEERTQPSSPASTPSSNPKLGPRASQRQPEQSNDQGDASPEQPVMTAPPPKARPSVASKSPELRRVSDKAALPDKKEEETSARSKLGSKPFAIATDKSLQEHPPRTPTKSYNTSLNNSSEGKPARALPLTPSKSKMNSPPKSTETRSEKSTSRPAAGAKPAGLGLDFTKEVKPVGSAVLTPPSDSELNVHTQKTELNNQLPNDPISSAIERFFGTIPKSVERADFDTEALLQSKPAETPRTKTISKQIWEVNGDGKRSPLPPQQEHILYEECMYLCVHTFEGAASSKSTEAYLWVGDSVPDAAVEDAQLFCRKVAREHSAKLELIRQGRESSLFFAALGGIIIIRQTKSSALYMLCGRRFDGHVSFDEVEMLAANLCSGFPYLISGKFGKLYLWKGQGAGTDEVSAARLISMDLSLTGEIEELSEGSEPRSFWETFPDRSKFQASETWALRSMDQQKGFPCHLYRVEPERPKSSGGFWGLRAASPPKQSNKMSLQEVCPFSQKDIESGSVHILDAYANIFVIPGSSKTPKPMEFVSALHIAQEIAVLSPSVEDRSLLPSCEVVFGEPPRDFRVSFRKWIPGINVDTSQESFSVEVAEVLRILD